MVGSGAGSYRRTPDLGTCATKRHERRTSEMSADQSAEPAAAEGIARRSMPVEYMDDLQESLAGLGELATGLLSLEESLTRVAQFAVRAIPGAEGAGLTLLEENRSDTIVATADFVTQVDDIQYSLGQGPCISAAADQQTVMSGSLGGDQRWPQFGSRVARLGVHSVVWRSSCCALSGVWPWLMRTPTALLMADSLPTPVRPERRAGVVQRGARPHPLSAEPKPKPWTGCQAHPPCGPAVGWRRGCVGCRQRSDPVPARGGQAHQPTAESGSSGSRAGLRPASRRVSSLRCGPRRGLPSLRAVQ
jgi:hypothetical protein